MMESYITVRQPASDELIIQKSRFLCFAFPCSTEDEALACLEKLRTQYRDATHHCYAYITGINGGIMRYSDDGEPGGTAGLPMMNVLCGEKVVNCCVVIVRYFGGTLLGTGGLVRAYTEGCKAALSAAGIVKMEMTAHELCEVPYSFWDTVRHEALKLPVRIDQESFHTAVTFRLSFRARDKEAVLNAMDRITARHFVSIPEDDTFDPWEND